MTTDQSAEPADGNNADLEPGAVPEPAGGRPRRRQTRAAFVRELVIIVVVALTLSFLVKTFLAQPYSIPSESMENTLDVGDRIIVSKFTPQHSPLHRGDVIVFENPKTWGDTAEPSENAFKRIVKDALTFVGVLPGGGHHLVKRVIGLPGDHVQATANGKVTVNGVPLTEPYIKPGNAPSATPFDITVPAGKVWVMGDNRGDSFDSRGHDNGTGQTGSVPESDISGEVVAIAWPLNRIQSVDSYPSVFAKVPNP